MDEACPCPKTMPTLKPDPQMSQLLSMDTSLGGFVNTEWYDPDIWRKPVDQLVMQRRGYSSVSQDEIRRCNVSSSSKSEQRIEETRNLSLATFQKKLCKIPDR